MKDYYKILGLKSNATDKEIKIAYRKLSKKYHPDLNGGDEYFEERFKDINEAYEKLNNSNYKREFAKHESNLNIKENESIQPKHPNSNTLRNVTITIAIILAIGIIKEIAQNVVRKNAMDNVMPIESIEPIILDTSATLTPTENNTEVDSIFRKNTDTVNLKSVAADFPSKIETERWILEKLNENAKNYVSCPSSDIIGYGNNIRCTTYKDYTFLFNGDYLEVRYNYDDKRYELVKIPLYDFRSILNNYSSITIFTEDNTMIETHSDNNSQKVTSLITIGLNTDTETDLVKRLEKAFKHLSIFYSKPITNEVF